MLEILFRVIVVSLLLWMGYYDFKTKTISDKLVLLMFGFGIVNLICFSSGILPFVIALVLFVLLFVYNFVGFRKGMVGGGDVKLFSVIPFVFPATHSAFTAYAFFYVLILTALLSIIFYIISRFVLKNEAKESKKIPMAFPLGIASLIVAFI